MPHHIVVLGGGIAGLYAAYEVVKQHKEVHVTVLEKADYWGGRIHTLRFDGAVMDVGAGRFSNNHKLLIQLLDELGFDKTKDLYPLGKKRQYVKDSKLKKFDTMKYIKELINLGKARDASHLKNMTLKMFMHECFPATVVDDVINSFGYNTEFDLMNAFDALQVFQTDFMDSIQYYILMGGLDRLVTALVANLKASKRCDLLLNHSITHIQQPNKVMTSNGKVFHFDTAFVCLTKSAINNIQGFETNKGLTRTLDTLGNGNLLRVFARFPPSPSTGKIWFHDIPRTTTNSLLRYIIPLNPATGLIMLSYTDGSYAHEWSTLPNVTPVMMTHVRKLFPNKDIPDPLWVRTSYWEEGTHCWLPGAKKYKNTRSSLSQHNYFVCGEMISDHNQAWIEGALESVATCLSLLSNRF